MEHLKYLTTTNLLDTLQGFYIGLVGKASDREAAKAFLDALNLKHSIVAESDTGFEQVTLNKLYEFALNNDGYVLYAHNKGTFNKTAFNQAWRMSMSYYVIVNWSQAITHLEIADAVGCHWITDAECPGRVAFPFFGGNFWWAHCHVVRQLGYPPTNSRYDAENWIGRKSDIKIHDLNPGWPTPELFKT
jgi:hypothetical protein